MKTETARTAQVTLRLEHEILARLDAIASKIERPGLKPTRTDTVRMVLLAGLPVVEAAEGIAQKPKRRR